MDASTLINLHENWAWVVIIGNGLAGIWSLAAHKVEPLRTRGLWWYIAFAQATMFVQVILGVIMVNRDKLEFPQFHAFYGFVGIIAIDEPVIGLPVAQGQGISRSVIPLHQEIPARGTVI